MHILNQLAIGTTRLIQDILATVPLCVSAVSALLALRGQFFSKRPQPALPGCLLLLSSVFAKEGKQCAQWVLTYHSRTFKSRSELRAAIGLKASLGNVLLHENFKFIYCDLWRKGLTLA